MGRPALERDGGAQRLSGSSDPLRRVTGNVHKRSLIDRVDDGETLGRIKEGGLLHSFIHKTDTSLEITRQNSKQARGRGLVDRDLTLNGDGPQELPHFEGVTFTSARPRRPLERADWGARPRSPRPVRRRDAARHPVTESVQVPVGGLGQTVQVSRRSIVGDSCIGFPRRLYP